MTNPNRSLKLAFAVIVVAVLGSTTASAQVARVFLAGTGNDAGDCSNQATPCRSLQGAVTACPVNGEIIVLDNGGYGGATITKSLTVNVSAGVVAFIARTITVAIASTDKVVLRGLSMNGVVFGDLNGIAFNAGGTLVVENSLIGGFNAVNGAGIKQAAGITNLIVNNCEFRNNYSGVLNETGGATNASTLIENSRFEYNGFYGVDVESGTANVSIRNSVFANNNGGVFAYSLAQLEPVLIVVDTCTVAHNYEGLYTQTGAAGSAIMQVTNSTIYHNGNGMVPNGAGAAVQSYGNNRVTANTSFSTFSGSVLPLQ